ADLVHREWLIRQAGSSFSKCEKEPVCRKPAFHSQAFTRRSHLSRVEIKAGRNSSERENLSRRSKSPPFHAPSNLPFTGQICLSRCVVIRRSMHERRMFGSMCLLMMS